MKSQAEFAEWMRREMDTALERALYGGRTPPAPGVLKLEDIVPRRQHFGAINWDTAVT